MLTVHQLRFFLLPFLIVIASCSCSDPVLESSDFAIEAPKDNSTFKTYLDKSKLDILSALYENESKRTLDFMGGYKVDEAAEMRSPYEFGPEGDIDCSEDGKGAGKAFLLIHGLTDSPYLLLDVAQQLRVEKHFPCALIRSIVLPGHGTVVGDTINMSYHDWRAATEFGIRKLTDLADVKQLYLVGFSTGTALITRFLNDASKHEKRKVKGAVLLSAAMKANLTVAFLTVPISWAIDWEEKFAERDAARFESFSYNAGAQFYLLTFPITASEYATDTPLLMAVSADDTTIDPEAALELFCESGNENNKMVWYQSSYTEENLNLQSRDEGKELRKNKKLYSCTGKVTINDFGDTPFVGNIFVEGVKIEDSPKYQVVNMAHTAVSISPKNPHYGPFGKYKQCKMYFGNANEYSDCINVTDDDLHELVMFAETNAADDIKTEKKKIFRRGTFNPFFDELISEIVQFSKLND